MADEVIHHTNARDRETKALPCGLPRAGALVTGDPKRVNCDGCRAAAK